MHLRAENRDQRVLAHLPETLSAQQSRADPAPEHGKSVRSTLKTDDSEEHDLIYTVQAHQ